MVDKVTEPSKIVTDTVLLSTLTKQGIDPEYVEFYQDYAPAYVDGKKVKGQSPYAKFYRDLKSNKRFMVASGLPMVDADGIKIEAGWRVAGINYFAEKNNLFRAKVQGAQIEVTLRNDQPDGRKAGDKLSFKPQLFLDGVEQFCNQSLLLPIDPLNSNYLENTLEWDYGICKRRLRIIEGRLLGSWVFASKASGIVRIKYNQTGNFKLRLGQFKVNDDEEIVEPEGFDELAKFQGGYPVTISDSLTVYPDIHPESVSVDGRVQYGADPATWATIHDALTGTFVDDNTDYLNAYVQASATANKWNNIFRSLELFDTSPLPDDAAITATTLTNYGYSASTGLGAHYLNIYSSTPASNTQIVVADYDMVGTTPFATQIQTTSWNIGDPGNPNDFIFNADGRAAISKTGISKFSLRVVCDATNSEPGWASAQVAGGVAWASDKGNGYKPKLVVTYIVGGGAINLQQVGGFARGYSSGGANLILIGF